MADVADAALRARNAKERPARNRGAVSDSTSTPSPRPEHGTNDQFADDDYSYSYDVTRACAEEVGFLDCLVNAVFAGEVTQDESTPRSTP